MGFLDLGKSAVQDEATSPVGVNEKAGSCERSEESELRDADSAAQTVRPGEKCELSEKSSGDPRTDLSDDSATWSHLLRLAWEWDQGAANGLYGGLHAFRCLGARLIWDGKCYRIWPGDGWETEDAFQQDRDEHLVPHAVALVRLLQALAEGHDHLTWWLRLECCGIPTGRPAAELDVPETRESLA